MSIGPRRTGIASALACDWLTAERAHAYANIVLVTTLAVGVLRVAMSLLGAGPLGFSIDSDFVSFWAASKLALGGHPENVYTIAIHWDVERTVLPDTGYSAFLYPPVWLLLCLPLALLPFWWSLAAFLGATGAGYWRVTHRMLPGAGVAFLAYPAVVTNVVYGQNGLLTTALFGGGLLALRRRPWIAGICFGCLAYKPHLAAIVPIALIAGQHWRALASTVATGFLLIAGSLAAFGVATWMAFFAEAPFARAVLEHGIVTNIGWASTFRAVVQLGGSVPVAYAAQGVVALVAIVAMVAMCRRRPDAMSAMLPLATLLASPFLLAYDLALLALPMAWLVRQGVAGRFLAWEKPVLGIAFLTPVATVLASRAGVPVLPPLVMLALLASATWRCLADPKSRAQP
jgi:hypothetical protein